MSQATFLLYFKEGVSNGLDTERYVGLMSRTYRRFRQDISRADFQALAAIVAVEKAVEENNAFCAEDTRVREGRKTVHTVLFWGRESHKFFFILRWIQI